MPGNMRARYRTASLVLLLAGRLGTVDHGLDARGLVALAAFVLEPHLLQLLRDLP